MSDAKRVFTRFKYAEEHAHDLLKEGHLFSLTVVPDVSHLDTDGETYVYDDFVVTDLGLRTDAPVYDSDLIGLIEAKFGPLDGGQVLVLRNVHLGSAFDQRTSSEQLLEGLVECAQARGLTGNAARYLPLVVCLDAPDASIELLDEDDMRAAGWVRA